MALEIFVQLIGDGSDTGMEHIFTGGSSDLTYVASTLTKIFETNRRARTIKTLADRFTEASKMPTPFLRLNKKECVTLVDAISEHAKDKGKNTKLGKLSAFLGVALAVY